MVVYVTVQTYCYSNFDRMQSKRTLTSLLVGTQHMYTCTEEGAIDNLSSNQVTHW